MNKSKSVMLIVSIAFLSFIAYQKYSLPLDTVSFNPETLYRGTTEGMTIDDPRDYYMRLNNLTFKGKEDDGCIPLVVSENNAIPITKVSGNYLPLVYHGDETDYTTLIGKDGENLFKDKQNIVMPVSNSKFKNSNLTDSTLKKNNNGQHDIEITKGDKILIIIEDVMTWWCHMHNTSATVQHDIRIGYNSNIESIRGGAIVGVAKDSTKLKVYRIKDDAYSDSHKIENVKDMNELQQIHAGKYLTEGTIEDVK